MELIDIKTADNYRLEGLFWESSTLSEIGAVFVHGWVGAYNPKYKDSFILGSHITKIAKILSNNGISTIATLNRGYHKPEFFNDCVFDIQANIDFLTSRGIKKIILLGHSLGGAKVAYFTGTQKRILQCRACVLMSAIPAIHDLYDKPEVLARSRDMIAKGEGELFFSRKEGNDIVTYHPDTFIKNYSLAYQKNTLDIIEEIGIPILSIAAEKEWEWFRVVLFGIKSRAKKSPRVDTKVFDSIADHTYIDYEEAVGEYVAKWIKEIIS